MNVNNPQPQVKVELGQKTQKEILQALTKIKAEISEAKKRQKTAADVAADVIASGGGPFAAAKEALSFKASKAKAKIKDRFDPLNIINRATGSKLATALAGRAMGRSEASIRSAAGLQKIEPTVPSVAEEVKETTKEDHKATRVENEKIISSLDLIAKSTAFTAKKVSDIADKMGASKKFMTDSSGKLRDKATGQFASKAEAEAQKEQSKLLNNIWKQLELQTTITEKFQDHQKDNAAAERYKKEFSSRKAAIVKDKKPEMGKEEKGGLLGFLGSLSPFLLTALAPLAAAIAPVLLALAPLAAAFGLVVTAAKMVYDKWESFGEAFTMAKESIVDFGGSIVSTVKNIGSWISDSLTAGGDLVIDAGRSIVNSVKSLVGLGETPEQQRAQLEKEAAEGNGYAQRKLAKEVAPQEKVSVAVEKVTPSITSGLNPSQTAVTKQSIEDGSLRQQVMDALTGKQSPSGSVEDRVAVGKVTSAVSKAYKETYKDVQGKPLISDPQLENRLPGVIDATLKSLSGSLPTMTPEVSGISKVSEVAAPTPRTGETLTEAADLKADSTITPINQQVAPVINTIKQNTVNNNTIQQTIPSARSSESSFMRASTRNFATS